MYPDISNNGFLIMNKKDNDEILNIRDELKNYNMYDFLAKVSALMLIPENQSKSVIFQIMISTALSIKEDEFIHDNIMSQGKFKYFVSRFSLLNRKEMIDPTEFPFCLPVIYYNNYYLFMGSDTLSPSYLNILLKLLSIYRKKLPSEENKRLNTIIIGLLTISSNIYCQLNIELGQLKSFDKDLEIVIPSSQKLKEYATLVKIDFDYMHDMFGDFFNELSINFGEIKIDEIFDFDVQKYYRKPFLFCGDNFILLDVTSFIHIIMNSIINSFRDNPVLNIIDEYNKMLIFDVHKFFHRMNLLELKSEKFNIQLEKTNKLDESLYLCGNDIVFYNIILLDDGSNFGEEYKYDIGKNFIKDRIKKITMELKNYGFDDNKIVTVITPTTIGRKTILSILLDTNKNIMALSPYELETISINEFDETMFLYKYIVARNKLKYYEKDLFVELNFIALFAENGYSFYFRDDCDMKETKLVFIGEYSSDYILKSYLKNNYHLARFDNRILLEVMRIEDDANFSPTLFYDRQMNYLLEFGNLNIWILSEKSFDNKLYDVLKMLFDMIAYWLSQFKRVLSWLSGIIYINIVCDKELSNIISVEDNQSGKINFSIDNSNLTIRFNKNSLQYFSENENGEKEFIIKVIKHIGEVLNTSFLDEEIYQMFSSPYKKKLIVFDHKDDMYMMPFKNGNQLKISKILENIILDEIGLYVKNELRIDYGKINDYKVLNNVVEYLYNNIRKKLIGYNKNQLLHFLYLEFEKNLSSLLIRQNNYAIDLACYPQKETIINEKINDINMMSVVLKFLIEMASSIKFNGKKNISFYDLEYMAAEASKIIEFAYVCDVYHYQMSENTLSLLKSNRLGYKRDFFNCVGSYLKDAKLYQLDASYKDKRKFMEKFNSPRNDISGFDDAFLEEFGFSFNDYTEITITLLDIAERKNTFVDNIFTTNLQEIKDNIHKLISEENIIKIINYLSLSERDNFFEPPLPYAKTDVFPWRNNRELSLNRRPLIQYDSDIIYGYRTLLNSINFLFAIINNGTLKARRPKMKEYLSLIGRERGDNYNDKAFNYLASFDNSIVDKKVNKINGKKIVDSTNNKLGDIDVLFISLKSKKIYVCETKNFELSRNMYEIYNEYHDMFDPKNQKSFYNRHMKRVNWCKNHIDDIIKHYKLPNKKWKVDYCFIINEPLISNKAMKINIKAYTLEDIEKYL